MIDERHYETVATLNDQLEASLLEELLKQENIPHVIEGHDSSMLEPIFAPQRPWGRVAAPPDFRPQVLEMLEAIRNAPPVVE